MSQPIRFGKYLLLDKIGTGGMAELFLAKQTGLSGFEKTVAIKRILPHLTQGAEFIAMFINEAKLAALLSHQNIVQIYDLGNVDQCHYIAMEYIMGKDLRTVINHGKSKSMPPSIGDALLIVSKICSALDYAHRKKDLNGNDLHLVHRDISPQNILVSYEGEVKLVDFGIAKAATGGQETKTGVLKGKLAYMSPEQAWGKPVDGRTDLFALGIVLYEAVTGERLFTGNDEISILEKVRKAEVPPPTQLNPAVPPELEVILKKAMAKEPEDRYQTASEMEMALEDLITKKGYAFSSLSLSHYMQALFADEILKDTRRLQQVTSQAHPVAPVEDRSTIVRPAHAAPPPVPADPAAAVRKSISQSKLIFPPPKGRRFSQWVSVSLLLSSWSIFLLLLFLSDIHFVARLRSKFPVLEESKAKISASLERTGLLSFLDGFQNGLFRLVETGNPGPPSHASSGEKPVGVTLARESAPASPPATPDTIDSETGVQPASLPPPAPDIPSLYREAKEDYHAGRLDEMERKLRQIIEIDPNEVQAYHLLGTVYQEKKEPDRALRIFADAAALFPKEAILHYDLGFLYFKKGVDSLAAQELNLAMKLSPRSPEAERAREILQKLGQRPQPAASLPKKKTEPPRPAAALPALTPKPETREETAEKPTAPPLQSAALSPAAPSMVDDQEQIRLLISNQKRGFEGKNIEGVLQGHLHPLPAFRQKVGEWFQRFDRVSVNYEVYELKIEGNEASVSALETIVLQSDKAASRQVEKALVFWKLEKVSDGWKIAKANVVEKY
ncbi:serine/threonine-protein kinase [Candidatus Manganitrophus noduliformans]|uniref:Protein kinase n=1 Tax=Candidatus Manganitrophus noduliformans TaxID=2606439 RepID=A0A7X6DRS4_9BACT|nr:serine/threonine-protein kinase [Candidatus Manganitrophus noduliformans]NKE72150.1 protein kinase [Candidatus Manganitrophus noduliformans]